MSLYAPEPPVRCFVKRQTSICNGVETDEVNDRAQISRKFNRIVKAH